jgi:hypothetical protein
VQRKSLFGLFVLLAVGLLLVSVKPAWASPIVTPSSPTAGVSFTINGDGSASGANELIVYNDGTCGGSGGTVVFSMVENLTPSYSVTLTLTSAGQYSASDTTGCRPFTVKAAPAPPIPEYPYGLTLLAILLVIGYGVVRRRINY